MRNSAPRPGAVIDPPRRNLDPARRKATEGMNSGRPNSARPIIARMLSRTISASPGNVRPASSVRSACRPGGATNAVVGAAPGPSVGAEADAVVGTEADAVMGAAAQPIHRPGLGRPPVYYSLPPYGYFFPFATYGYGVSSITTEEVTPPPPLPETGFLRLDVEPRHLLQVFVDGLYVGTIADLGDDIELGSARAASSCAPRAIAR